MNGITNYGYGNALNVFLFRRFERRVDRVRNLYHCIRSHANLFGDTYKPNYSLKLFTFTITW